MFVKKHFHQKPSSGCRVTASLFFFFFLNIYIYVYIYIYRTNTRTTHLSAGATFHLSWMCLSARAAARQVQKKNQPSFLSCSCCSCFCLPTEGCSSAARGCTQITTDSDTSETLDVGGKLRLEPNRVRLSSGYFGAPGTVSEGSDEHQSHSQTVAGHRPLIYSCEFIPKRR